MAQMDKITQDLIDGYRTPEVVIEKLRHIKTVIITGISAAGKDTIQQGLLADEQYSKVVTSTTREPRKNNGVMEIDGVDYYFLTLEEAQKRMRDGEYIEVMNVHGNVNGSLVKEYERISQLGSVALSDIDYQGAAHFLDFDMQELSVFFVVPPSFDVWFKRLTERYGDSLDDNLDEIIKRMQSAQKEIAFAQTHPEFIPVLNDQIERVTGEIKAIVNGTPALSEEMLSRNYELMAQLLEDINSYLSIHA